jgi:hypothetical protein
MNGHGAKQKKYSNKDAKKVPESGEEKKRNHGRIRVQPLGTNSAQQLKRTAE